MRAKAVLVLASLLGTVFFAVTPSSAAGSPCTGSPIFSQVPPTILQPNPSITYGGTVSCSQVKTYVHVVALLGDETNCCPVVDSVERTRSNSAGFTLTDTYAPNVCSAISLGRTHRWRLDLLWDWKNADGTTDADYDISYFTTTCPLKLPLV